MFYYNLKIMHTTGSVKFLPSYNTVFLVFLALGRADFFFFFPLLFQYFGHLM